MILENKLNITDPAELARKKEIISKKSKRNIWNRLFKHIRSWNISITKKRIIKKWTKGYYISRIELVEDTKWKETELVEKGLIYVWI